MKTLITRRQSVGSQPRSDKASSDFHSDLKKSLSQRLAREFSQCIPLVVIRRAIDDAAEVAESTDFPHLFFPTLAEEKVRLVSVALCQELASPELLDTAA